MRASPAARAPGSGWQPRNRHRTPGSPGSQRRRHRRQRLGLVHHQQRDLQSCWGVDPQRGQAPGHRSFGQPVDRRLQRQHLAHHQRAGHPHARPGPRHRHRTNGAVWVIGTNAQNGSYEVWAWKGSSWVADPGSGEEIAVQSTNVVSGVAQVAVGSGGTPWAVDSVGELLKGAVNPEPVARSFA